MHYNKQRCNFELPWESALQPTRTEDSRNDRDVLNAMRAADADRCRANEDVFLLQAGLRVVDSDDIRDAFADAARREGELDSGPAASNKSPVAPREKDGVAAGALAGMASRTSRNA